MKLEETRVFGLDMMRATAITLVLTNHAAIWLVACSPIFFIGCLAGYFGVELFFVLSGFLIGGILFRWLTDAESTCTLVQFWKRRWFRTLPLYFLFLVINTALFLWLQHRMPPAARYVLFLQNIASTPPPFFKESWSLAIEEWFYLLVPILLFFAAKRAPRDFRRLSLAIILGVIATVTVARAIYVAIEEPDWINGVRMIVAYRLDACMFGVLAAWAKCYWPTWWRSRQPLLWIGGLGGFVVVAWLVLTVRADSLVLHMAGFPATSLAAALLLPTLDGWRSAHGALARKSVTCISLWSYSLYLVNMPVFVVLSHVIGGAPKLLCMIFFLSISFALSALIYRFYEKPMTRLRDRRRIIVLDSRQKMLAPAVAS